MVPLLLGATVRIVTASQPASRASTRLSPGMRRTGDGLVAHSHRASVERQERLRTPNIHPLRRNADSYGLLGLLIVRGARTADALRRIKYPDAFEVRDLVRQCDGCAGNSLAERPQRAEHQDSDNDDDRWSQYVPPVTMVPQLCYGMMTDVFSPSAESCYASP